MARYKPVDRSPRFLPIVLSEQIQPGTFEFALDHLVDHELDLCELDARFRNDETGANAYDPRVMLKIVLLAYSRGLISSRAIERAWMHNGRRRCKRCAKKPRPPATSSRAAPPGATARGRNSKPM